MRPSHRLALQKLLSWEGRVAGEEKEKTMKLQRGGCSGGLYLPG